MPERTLGTCVAQNSHLAIPAVYDVIMRTFRSTVRVSGTDVGEKEVSAVSKVFSKGYLGMGAEVIRFENELAEMFGRPVACVSTGTAALQLALQSAGVGPGAEVLVPSLTYVAGFQAISATGATPVSVDVLQGTLTMDPKDARNKVSAATRAIMPVYYGGGIARMGEIYELARLFSLRVIEDAAHAFGSFVDGSLVGSKGDIVCFSFDPIKNMTSGEGGCVVTSDSEVLETIKDLRLLGVRGDSVARASERRLYEFDVQNQGWRYHMNNVNAAIGLAQLSDFNKKSLIRQKLAQIYNSMFAEETSITPLPYNYEEVVPHIYVIRLQSKEIRDTVRGKLREDLNVETALHWFPNHFLSKYKNPGVSLPTTESEFEKMLTIPLHTKLGASTVTRIASFIIEAVRGVNQGVK